MLKNINEIYICHYTKLTDRKIILQEKINELGLNVNWVECYDKEDLDINNILSKHTNYNTRLNIQGHQDRFLRHSEISLIFKHNYIWEQMVDKDIDNVLVLEDDVVFSDNFVEKFNNYTNDLPLDYDLLWVGSCCNIHATTTEGIYIYEGSGSRCTHAYMISKKCAIKMLEYHKINNSPVDFMFNFAINKYNFKNYWLEPSLIEQNEKFNSSIQNVK